MTMLIYRTTKTKSFQNKNVLKKSKYFYQYLFTCENFINGIEPIDKQYFSKMHKSMRNEN